MSDEGIGTRRLLLVTTVPETLATILKYQPRYLSAYFDVSLATSPGKEISQILESEGLQVHRVSMSRGISPLKDIWSLLAMIKLLLVVKPDLIHSYTPKAGLIAMLAGWVCRVPRRVHTFTGLIFPTAYGVKRVVLKLVDKVICFAATCVVPEGGGVKNDLQRFGITRKPLSVIGYGNIAGVDTAHFSSSIDSVQSLAVDLRGQLSISDSDFVFCFVGRLNRDKGLRELVEAFSVLPDSARLILVGDEDLSAPVDDLTSSVIESHPRIHRLGFLRDIRPAVFCSDVLVLPSYREGFPNVVLQAGAMEVPVIATDINGCNEVIEDGYNGWLVPPRNSRELAVSMRNVMCLSRAELDTIGSRARCRVGERFERSVHWERMKNFYSSFFF